MDISTISFRITEKAISFSMLPMDDWKKGKNWQFGLHARGKRVNNSSIYFTESFYCLDEILQGKPGA